MATKWRTTMKRVKLEKDEAEFVFGVTLADGSRFELDGVIDKGVLDDVFGRLTKSRTNARPD